MRKILFIALLLVCITARKDRKKDEAEKAMDRCMDKHCIQQGWLCFLNEQCMKTFKSCDEKFGDGITGEQLGECTAEDAVAQDLVQCMADHCSGIRALMKMIQRRRQH